MIHAPCMRNRHRVSTLGMNCTASSPRLEGGRASPGILCICIICDAFTLKNQYFLRKNEFWTKVNVFLACHCLHCTDHVRVGLVMMNRAILFLSISSYYSRQYSNYSFYPPHPSCPSVPYCFR